MSVVAIVSGGLDSVTMAHMAAHTSQLKAVVSFDYGQRHARELDCAARCAERLGVPWRSVTLPRLGRSALTSGVPVPEGHYAEASMQLTVVPARNAIMLSVAAGIAVEYEATSVGYGAHAGDHPIYPDCRPDFMEAMGKALQLGYGVGVWAPWIRLAKHAIVAKGPMLGVPWQDTWTCYQGGEKPCGRCGTCVERLEAFDIAALEDPLDYEDRDFWKAATA